MALFTTLYIMKYDISAVNSVYKIGITGDLSRRFETIERSLGNKRLSIVWTAKFIFAYPLEQMLHIVFKPLHYDMPATLSGYTEFFDLNVFSVYLLTSILDFYIMCRFFFYLCVLWVIINLNFCLSYFQTWQF
jgi:Meiotically up-regulated gene 113